MTNYIHKHKDLFLVFLGSLILCLIGSGAYPIYILDEAKNAEAAREMLSKAEFIIPTFNNILRTDKPPLHYYFMMLGYKIFGIGAFGARFFSGIFGALTIFTSFYYIAKFATKHLAWVFAILCWSSIFFIQEFHLAVPDPYLIFFISIGLWFFFDFYNTKSKIALWFMYIAFALGTLTKGPVAIALPGLICLLFLICTKKLNIKELLSYKPFLGLAILLVISLPWYIAVHIETAGAWTKGFFLDHNLNRFGSKMEGHGGIFLITWAFVLLGLMPFSFFAFYAFKHAYTLRKENTLLLFSAIVSIVFIVFFSISGTKLPNYTMPCYPFLALTIAATLKDVYHSNKKSNHITTVIILITILAIALPIAGKFALLQDKTLKTVSHVAYWLIPTSIITSIGTYFYFCNKLKKAFFTIAVGWIIIVPILFLAIYPQLTPQNPVEKAQSIIKNKKHIVAYKRFDAAFPINFQQTFKIIKTQEEITSFFNQFPNGYLLTNDKKISPLENRDDLYKFFEGKALFESHTTRIYKKKTK